MRDSNERRVRPVWIWLVAVACLLWSPTAAYLTSATTEANTKQVAQSAAERAKCDNPLPSTFGQWLVPNNLYRINLNRPTFSSREQQVSQRAQIAELIATIGSCYNIKSTAATTASMKVDAPIAENTQVWNDTLILTLERRR
jgi:hypothetical protein